MGPAQEIGGGRHESFIPELEGVLAGSVSRFRRCSSEDESETPLELKLKSVA